MRVCGQRHGPEYCKPCQDHYNSTRKPYPKDKQQHAAFKSRLKTQFGMTVGDYERMLVEQDGVCAICRGLETEPSRTRLSVDHDHKTGKVRALLCARCNKMLGMLEDNRTRAGYVLAYLIRHAEKKETLYATRD